MRQTPRISAPIDHANRQNHLIPRETTSSGYGLPDPKHALNAQPRIAGLAAARQTTLMAAERGPFLLEYP